jgi:Arc/MetJ-type ribon-helix-helix transcriptional regulator
MTRLISVNAKRRGRPATGQDPVSAVRLPGDLTEEIDSWARKHDTASRSEAIRRLVELGLKAKTAEKPVRRPGRRRRAQELAAEAIDKLGDSAASTDERDERRRRLTKGPSEFRKHRVDLPKAKRT